MEHSSLCQYPSVCLCGVDLVEMPEISLVDGFAEVHESLAEMITNVANEPSLGLFFVQQHAHKSVPKLSYVKNKLVDTSQEAFLCTEDMNDALTSVKLLKEYGPSIINRMIENLDSSVLAMSSLNHLRRTGGNLDQPNAPRKRNTVQAVWNSAFQKGGSSHWRSHASGLSQERHCNRESSSSTLENDQEPITCSSGMIPTASDRYLRPLKSVLQRVGSISWRRGMLPRSYSAEDMKVVIGSGRSARCEYATDEPSIFTSEAVAEERSAFSGAHVDNDKKMDQDDQLPVSTQPLFLSDDDREMQIFETAEAAQSQTLMFQNQEKK